MQIKTFQAPDLATALAAAREQLGADAKILETKRISGPHGRSSVELVVAVDRPAVAKPALRSELARLSREVLRIQKRKRETRPSTVPPTPDPTPARTSPSPSQPIDCAAERLIASGLSPDLVKRFEQIARREWAESGTAQAAAVATARGMESLLPFQPWHDRGGMIFLIGSPGAGKTTCAVKIAARCSLEQARPVVFVQADQQRIGADEQARVFADAIGFDLRHADGAGELRTLLTERDPEALWIVDTCGIGPADDRRMEALRLLRGAAPDAETALVVPAGTHPLEVRQTLRRFAPTRPTCVAISKLDGAPRLGELVNELEPTGLPLSFTTHGHEIPQDLEPATPGRLAKWLLKPSETTV